MGMSAGPARRARRGKAAAISEINVTPMVDVMLVLLIIFMVAAPLMTVGVPIDLPETQAQAMEPEKRPITVTVTAEGAISVDGEPVALETLAAHVSSLATDGTDERLLVRGDRAAGYGAVMKVMGTLSAAGFSKLGLVSETADVR